MVYFALVQISGCITVESQMKVRAERRRKEAILDLKLKQQLRDKVAEVRHVVQELRRQFGDDHDPTLQLQQVSLYNTSCSS